MFPLLRDGKVWTGYNKGSFVFEVPIDKAIFVRHVVKKFLLLQIQKEEYRNIIDEAKKEDYTNKECIYINGLWDEFLDFAKQQVEQELKETKK